MKQTFTTTVVLYTTILLAILTGGNTDASPINKAKKDSVTSFTHFCSIVDKDNIYLNWKLDIRQSGFYIIERSENNNVFEYAGHLECVNEDCDENLIHSFVGKITNKKFTYYRIIHINMNGEVIKSQSFKVYKTGKTKFMNYK